MRSIAAATFLSLLTNGVLAGPLIQSSNESSKLPLHSRTVFQLSENDTWLENIAVRSNGALLATLLLPSASLYQLLEPWSNEPGEAELLYSFPNATSLLGIAETDPDVFVIAAGNLTADVVGVPNTWSLWEVDFNHPSRCATDKAENPFTVHKIIDLPDALFLNGMTVIPAQEDSGPVVLVSDSTLGLVYSVQPRTGASSIAVKVPEMTPLTDSPPIIGVNGIKYAVNEGYLYFDNSLARTLYRIAINTDGSVKPNAAVETVATISGAPFLDDFVFGPGDSTSAIWVTTNPGDTVDWVDVTTGKSIVVVGSNTTLTVAGDTAAAFGRTTRDWDTLYVVTGGTVASPVNGTVKEPAKIVAVDTKGFKGV